MQVCWYFGAGRFLGEGPAPQIGFLWPVMAPVCALLSDLRRPPNVADSTFGTFRLQRRCGTDWKTTANLVSLHRQIGIGRTDSRKKNGLNSNLSVKPIDEGLYLEQPFDEREVRDSECLVYYRGII